MPMQKIDLQDLFGMVSQESGQQSRVWLLLLSGHVIERYRRPRNFGPLTARLPVF